MSIARVRVELRPGVRYDERAVRQMLQEFRRKCSDAGIMHAFKEHQFFESESSKARKKHRDCVNKNVQDNIEMKLNRGEKVRCSSKLIKKIRAKQAKAARAAKRDNRDRRTN